MVLSIGFIISVVALHSKSHIPNHLDGLASNSIFQSLPSSPSVSLLERFPSKYSGFEKSFDARRSGGDISSHGWLLGGINAGHRFVSVSQPPNNLIIFWPPWRMWSKSKHFQSRFEDSVRPSSESFMFYYCKCVELSYSGMYEVPQARHSAALPPCSERSLHALRC